MQHKQNHVRMLALLLGAVIVVCGAVLMTRDVPPTRHAVEKQLDAHAILDQK